MRFSEWTLPGLADFSFTVIPGRDRATLSISVSRSAQAVLYLSMRQHRVVGACFAYDLTPDALRELISELRAARHGLERWIVPGLEHHQASSTVRKDRRETYAILPELLESVRDLPVAEAWQRTRRELRREWAEHLREHPEDVSKVPAPWLLPDAMARGVEAKRQTGKRARLPKPAGG